ncbi:MAG: GNAT family N-acetyltransferase [Candidatus Latescibacterota bacterium]
MFEFRQYPPLTDGEVDLVLWGQHASDAARGWVPSYDFRIVQHGTRTRLGSLSLRVGDTEHVRLYVGHIGYGIAPPHRGHRYAASACQIVARVALDHGLEDLWITCNPDNLASRRTCEIIGARFVELVEVPRGSEMYRQGETRKCRYLWRPGALGVVLP